MSEATVTNPAGTEVSQGSERRRTNSEIQAGLAEMLRADYVQPEEQAQDEFQHCLLYTSPSPRDLSTSRMTSSA